MKLSIITINYNNCSGLQKTIDSIVAQTWHDFEWIVIDGGSTDGSKELLEKYKEYFSYWCSEPDKGVYNAMNKGVAKAKGDYMNFMNSGDVFANEHVLQTVFSLSPEEDLLFGDWILEYTDKQVYVKEPETLSLHRFFYWCICHQAMFIKSSVLKQKGYDESYCIVADWKRWLEALINGCSVFYIPELICVFDATGISFTNEKRLTEERNRLFEEDFVRFKEFRDFYWYRYEYPDLLPIFDLYSSSRVNRKVINLVIKSLNTLQKNKLFLKIKNLIKFKK